MRIEEAASITHCHSLYVEKQPHLILHFDMNKTLIASDRQGGKTSHDVVSADIAGLVMDYWNDSLVVPISYADYVNHYLLPNPNNSREIKNQQKEKISKVLQFLDETAHPDYARMQRTYHKAIAALEKQETQVFNSFYRLIEFLNESGASYTLVIRTYGSEGSEVARELNNIFGESFIEDFRSLQKGYLDGSEYDLYKLVANIDHHLLVQDDYDWWFSHGKNWKYGKPFPVDLGDSKTISLFFDDNAKIDVFAPESNIVFPYDAASGEPISPSQLIDQGRLIPVEMLEALCDENYYIRFVEEAMRESLASVK